ncbi:MAG TPA: hypothetical protein HA362_05615 [Nanoarchaeota archaeon]|nr:hypothetical protein [Nanoarchaeota archaeon]
MPKQRKHIYSRGLYFAIAVLILLAAAGIISYASTPPAGSATHSALYVNTLLGKGTGSIDVNDTLQANKGVTGKMTVSGIGTVPAVPGILGMSTANNGFGVMGQATGTNSIGVQGSGTTGVSGSTPTGSYMGLLGMASAGVEGRTSSGVYGRLGDSSGYGVYTPYGAYAGYYSGGPFYGNSISTGPVSASSISASSQIYSSSYIQANSYINALSGFRANGMPGISDCFYGFSGSGAQIKICISGGIITSMGPA